VLLAPLKTELLFSSCFTPLFIKKYKKAAISLKREAAFS
jgi:hypothetical protein